MSEFEVRDISTEEIQGHIQKHAPNIFDAEFQIFRLRQHLDKEKNEQVEELNKYMGSPIRINLAVFKDREFVGWSWGYQESAVRFYMCNSAVLPQFRKLGVYTLLLKTMLEKVQALGFLEVTSRHVATNNAVLIPKLKVGFVISSMEVSAVFGVLIHLVYHLVPLQKKILDYRTGMIKPDEEIRKVFGF